MLLVALAVCVLTLIGYLVFFRNPPSSSSSSECSNNVAADTPDEEDLTEPSEECSVASEASPGTSEEPVASAVSSSEPVVKEECVKRPAAAADVSLVEVGTPERCVATEPVVPEVSLPEPSSSEERVAGPVVPDVSLAEPGASELSETEPVASELSETEPVASELSVTEPGASELTVTEPVASELSVTESGALDLSASEPGASELSATDPVSEPVQPAGQVEPLAAAVVQLQVHPEVAEVEPPATDAKVVEETAATLAQPTTTPPPPPCESAPVPEAEEEEDDEGLTVVREEIQSEPVMDTPVGHSEEEVAAQEPSAVDPLPEQSAPESAEARPEQETAERKPDTETEQEEHTIQNTEREGEEDAVQQHPAPESSQNDVLNLAGRDLRSVKFTVGESSVDGFPTADEEELENKIMNDINVEISSASSASTTASSSAKTAAPPTSDHAHNQQQQYHHRINNRLSHSSPSKYSGSKLSADHSSLSKIMENEYEERTGGSCGDIVEARTLESLAEMDKPKLKRQETMYDSAEVVTFCSRMNICCGIFKNPADHKTHYYRKRYKVPADGAHIPIELRNIAASFRVWGKFWDRIHHVKICQRSCAVLEQPSKGVHRLEDQREDCQTKYGCKISLQDFDHLGAMDKKVLGDLLDKIHNNFVSEDDLEYFNLQDDTELVEKFYFDL